MTLGPEGFAMSQNDFDSILEIGKNVLKEFGLRPQIVAMRSLVTYDWAKDEPYDWEDER